MHIKKKRELAERYFIEEQWQDKRICEDLEIPQKTLWVWKKGRKGERTWDERRLTLLSAPHKIKEQILAAMDAVSKGEESTVDADKLVKLAKSMEAVNKKVSVQMVITVFKEFDNWFVDVDPAKAIEFMKFSRQFVHHKASQE